MRLVSRHILRALAAPFIWGLAALTGLLLLQQLAMLIDKFGGRGLSPMVMVEAFVLTLPALLALSLPMAVLVASLYGYSQLAGDLELVAMYANGISVWRMARPALIAAIFVTLLNFFLYDQLVPRSNLQFSRLQNAVFHTSPTLTFQPGVMNPLNPATYVLEATVIDPVTSSMREITIYDLGNYGVTRIIHADSGLMRQSPDGDDLLLDLAHGTTDEFRLGESGRFQRTTFSRTTYRIRDVSSKLNRAIGANSRGDRDMTGCELLGATEIEDWNATNQRREIESTTRNDLRTLVGLPPLALQGTQVRPIFAPRCGKWYLRFEDWIDHLLPTKAQAESRPPVQQPVQQPAQQPETPAVRPPDSSHVGISPFLVPPAQLPGGQPSIARGYNVDAQVETLRSYQLNALSYRVEYHKKFAIPLASFCFVLLGMALALKYPRSGIGLVIGASMVIFLGFYILLIGGENVAKRGYLSPFVAIQGPLVIFTLLGLLAVRSANREMGTARTSGIVGALFDLLARLRRKPR